MAKHISISNKIKNKIATNPIQHTHITHPNKYTLPDSNITIFESTCQDESMSKEIIEFENNYSEFIDSLKQQKIVNTQNEDKQTSTINDNNYQEDENRAFFELEYQEFIGNLKQTSVKQKIINELTTQLNNNTTDNLDTILLNILNKYNITNRSKIYE